MFILNFKGKYREFFGLLNQNDSNAAGKTLVQLLEEPRLIPLKLKKRVLFDLVDLIKKVHFLFNK